MKTEPLYVFDTNVLVSGFLFRQSVPRQAFDLAGSLGRVIYSDETPDELYEVLVRPKFDRYLPLADRLHLLQSFEKTALRQTVSIQITRCRDPKDDKFLSLASSANATCLTSGDADLLVLAGQFPFPICTPADFLNRFSAQN